MQKVIDVGEFERCLNYPQKNCDVCGDSFREGDQLKQFRIKKLSSKRIFTFHGGVIGNLPGVKTVHPCEMIICELLDSGNHQALPEKGSLYQALQFKWNQFNQRGI